MSFTATIYKFGLAAMLSLPIGTFTASAQSYTFGTELGTGRIICTDDSDYTPNDDDPSYALAAAWDAYIFGDREVPCYAPLSDLDPGVWKQSEPFKGRDENGNEADFKIYVLHDAYSWALGSTWQLELNGEEVDPTSIFQAPNFMDRFCNSNTAFAFGASSHEGPRKANERTSGERAKTVSTSLSSVRASCEAGRIPIIFSVNLGEHAYDPSCPTSECSVAQRRVIIISASDISTDLNLPQALAKGIEDQRVFKGLDVKKYSLFDMASQ